MLTYSRLNIHTSNAFLNTNNIIIQLCTSRSNTDTQLKYKHMNICYKSNNNNKMLAWFVNQTTYKSGQLIYVWRGVLLL